MGACEFFIAEKGKAGQDTFNRAVDEARYLNGHGGYTGTIAEKDSFVMIPRLSRGCACALPEIGIAAKPDSRSPAKGNARAIPPALMDIDDARITDKWGPAGCFKIGEGEFLFFGWASS